MALRMLGDGGPEMEGADVVTLVARDGGDSAMEVLCELPLTAQERQRSRYRYEVPGGPSLLLRLPRGTVLADGDVLRAATGERVRVRACPEPTLRVMATSALELATAAYHLGNRHVPLEILPDGLRLEPDSVLADLLRGLGLEPIAEVAPFQPVGGAYGDRAMPAHPAHHGH